VDIGERAGQMSYWYEHLISENAKIGTMTAQQWSRIFDAMDADFASLPKVTLSDDADVAAGQRAGLEEGFANGIATQSRNHTAVFVAGELVKMAILHKASGAPGVASIGAVGETGDCTALTAARIFRTVAGAEITGEGVMARWGLAPVAIDSFRVAKLYALRYFKAIGIELAESPTDMTNTSSLAEGSYAVFFKGADENGHVLYGNMTRSEGLQLIDDQSGKTFNSIVGAQNELNMQFAGSYRVMSVRNPTVQQ
jgi:hypothetical protein